VRAVRLRQGGDRGKGGGSGEGKGAGKGSGKVRQEMELRENGSREQGHGAPLWAFSEGPQRLNPALETSTYTGVP